MTAYLTRPTHPPVATIRHRCGAVAPHDTGDGTQLCGEPARLFKNGWRCDWHSPPATRGRGGKHLRAVAS